MRPSRRLTLACLGFLLSLAGTLGAREAAPVTVSVDWTHAGGATPTGGYGSNVFTGLDPSVSSRSDYLQAMQAMGLRLLRLHSNSTVKLDSPKCWLNADGLTWNEAKIAAVFQALEPLQADYVVNIPGWPAAWHQSGSERLDPAHLDDYARLCASLVEIVGRHQKRGVLYWENLNEREIKYPETPEGMAAFARIFVRSARAMQAASPVHLRIAPAWTHLSEPKRLALFLAEPGVKEELGFFAFHQYATPRRSDLDGSEKANQWLFQRATTIVRQVEALKQQLSQAGCGQLELLFDEYNLASTYDLDDHHLMQGDIAMIFEALLHKHLAEGPTHARLFSWNECDGAYGLMDENRHLRPAGRLFGLSNHFLIGTWYPAHTGAATQVEAFAVRGADGTEAVLLINLSAEPSRVRLDMQGHAPSSATWQTWSLGASSREVLEHPGTPDSWKTLEIKGHSVLLCTWPAGVSSH